MRNKAYLENLYSAGEQRISQLINKINDPIRKKSQEVEFLVVDLKIALQTLAELKSLLINSEKEISELKKGGKKNKKNAKRILKKAEKGKIEKKKANNIATNLLMIRDSNKKRIEYLENMLPEWNANVTELEKTAKVIKERIKFCKKEISDLNENETQNKLINKALKLGKDKSKDFSKIILKLEELKQQIMIKNDEESFLKEYDDIEEIDDFLKKTEIEEQLMNLKNGINKKSGKK